jgi:predicted amidohydrolase
VVRRPELRAGYLQVALLTHDDLLASLDEHGVDVAVGPHGVLRSGDRSLNIALASFADDELLDPGTARAAALDGAELVVWHARRVSSPFVEEVARTRALENRVFVLLWQPPERGGPCVIDPNGAVIARSGGVRFAVQASCLRAAVATKTMAPGTDAWDAVEELFGRGVPGP